MYGNQRVKEMVDEAEDGQEVSCSDGQAAQMEKEKPTRNQPINPATRESHREGRVEFISISMHRRRW